METKLRNAATEGKYIPFPTQTLKMKTEEVSAAKSPVK